jgi:hypothetical protein
VSLPWAEHQCTCGVERPWRSRICSCLRTHRDATTLLLDIPSLHLPWSPICVMRLPIKFQCFGVWIWTRLPCINKHTSIHPSLTMVLPNWLSSRLLIATPHVLSRVFVIGCWLSFFPTLDSWPLKMGPIRCPETSVNNYHTTPRNIPEERRSHIIRRS